MDFLEFFSIIDSFLSEEFKSNIHYTKLKKIFFDIVNQSDVNYFVEVNSKLLEEHPYFQDYNSVIPIDGGNDCIFAIEFEDEKLNFSFIFDEIAKFSLKYSSVNEFTEDVIVDLEFHDSFVLWKTIKEVSDDKLYLQDFDVDVVRFSLDNKVIDNDKSFSDRLDIFQEFFALNREDARRCVNNFKENKEFLNNSKMKAEMSVIDDMFSLDFCRFVAPLRMCDFKDRIVCDLLKYLDEEFDVSSEIESRINVIYENLVNLVGTDGEFVFTFNLIINIIHYVMLDCDLLYSNGIIVRKFNNEFIVFNVNFSNEDILVIPSNTDLDYLRSLYLSNEGNSEIPGLDEFFGFGNSRRLG